MRNDSPLISEDLQEVLDDLAVLPYFAGEDRNNLIREVTKKIRGFQSEAAGEALDYLYFYVATNEEKELIKAQECIIELLSSVIV